MAAWWLDSAFDAARQKQCQRWADERSHCSIDVSQKKKTEKTFPEVSLFFRKLKKISGLIRLLGDKEFLT
jgi:hypothetical protein